MSETDYYHVEHFKELPNGVLAELAVALSVIRTGNYLKLDRVPTQLKARCPVAERIPDEILVAYAIDYNYRAKQKKAEEKREKAEAKKQRMKEIVEKGRKLAKDAIQAEQELFGESRGNSLCIVSLPLQREFAHFNVSFSLQISPIELESVQDEVVDYLRDVVTSGPPVERGTAAIALRQLLEENMIDPHGSPVSQASRSSHGSPRTTAPRLPHGSPPRMVLPQSRAQEDEEEEPPLPSAAPLRRGSPEPRRDVRMAVPIARTAEGALEGVAELLE